MSIPSELVYRAARDLYEQELADNIEAGVTPHDWPHWEELSRLGVQQKYLIRARRIITSVAEGIWQEGYDAGDDDAWLQERGRDADTPNPYEREEKA